MKAPLLAALAVLLPLAARAQEEPTRPLYLSLRGGVATPKETDLRNWEDGIVLEGAAGWRTDPRLAIELSLARYALGVTYRVTDAAGSPGTARATLAAVPLLAQARAFAPLDRAELSVVMGAGVQYASETGLGARSTHAFGSGFLLGGGLSARIVDGLAVTTEARYVFGTVTLRGSSIHLDAVLFEAGLTWSY
jgi:opacity protein-like surface antigen